MGDLTIRSNNGGEVSLSEADISAFRSTLKGHFLLPGDDGYNDARTIWNAMIDRHPAIIVQPQNVDDIVSAVNFARNNGLLLCVKGGGHNIAGNAVCEDGLMIDLSGMNSV